jgi:putative transposase
VKRAYKAEIEPNNVQRTLLLKHAGTARFAWNWGLSRRIQEYKETGKSSNAIDQHRQLNELKKTDFPWMYDVSKAAPQEALRNLDKAYDNFFRRVKNGEKPGFSKFKSKKAGKSSFRLTGSIQVTATHIKLPRIGWLKLKEQGYVPTDGPHILSVTISETAGRWFVSVQCEQEFLVSTATGEPVGVDLGIKSMAVCSDGQRFENPKALKKAQKKLRRVQRELSRRKKGGSNRDKTRQKLAKVHYRIANIRKDALHKATSAITARTKPDSERPGVVVIENLHVAGMVKNHGLAQAIVDVGFGEFRRQTE